MPYVPGCSHDIFISYASENNRDGWVDQFVEKLGRELSELLGSRQFNPREAIFFDRARLEIGQSFPDELAWAAKHAAIFIPILSPGYLTSRWCNRERTEFFSRLPSGAAPAGCVAPIVIRPVDETSLDSVTRNAQRLSFLSPDDQTPLAAGSPEWTKQIYRLAGQLKLALQKLRRGCKPVFVGKAAEAEQSHELRAWCCAELEQRYYRTVPESLPALDDSERIHAYLQDAGLAIHFLGGADPAALEAIELSVAVCSGPTIVYQPFGVPLTPIEELWLPDFERQLVQTGGGGYHRLAGKNAQELLAVIDEQITLFREIPIRDDNEPDVAFVCEDPDLDSVRQLREDIRTRCRIDITWPDFLTRKLKAMERLRTWQQYLGRSRALLFYLGASERERLQLMWKTATHNRNDIQCHWFLAPPDFEAKRRSDPGAFWTVEQVIGYLDTKGRAQRA